MTYLLVCSLIFAIVSFWLSEYRILTVTTFTNYVISVSVEPYFSMILMVSSVTFYGAIKLSKCGTTHGYYQSLILFLTMLSYWLLSFDVIVMNGNFLIYDNFEAVIYVLVVAKFFIICKSLWNFIIHRYSNYSASMVNN